MPGRGRYTRPRNALRTEADDGLECTDAVVAGRRRAGGGRAGHRHLLPADAGAGLRGRRAGRACRAAALPAQMVAAALRRRAAPPRAGTPSARARRARRRPNATATSTSTSARRCRSTPGTPTARRACSYRGAAWTVRYRRRRARRRRATHVIVAVQGNQLRRRARRRLNPRRKRRMEIAIVLAVIAVIFIVRTTQDRAAAERLGGRAPGQVRPHADAGPELRDPLHRPRGLQAFAEGSAAGRAQPGLHHQGQHAAAGGRHPVLPGHRPDARQLRLAATTSSPSRSWRRPRCAA